MNPSLLPALAWFALVARYRSFSRAADAMGVSRAALSQSLRELEKKLGVRLLYRTTRDMSLTEAGQQLFDTIAPALATIERGVAQLGETAATPGGLLRINTSRLAARVLLEPHLAEFCQRYPAIRCELQLDDTLANIIADGCDVGIRPGLSLAEHVVAVPISSPITMQVAASPACIARYGTPLTPADLNRYPCINYRFAGTGALRQWDFHHTTTGHFTQAVTGSLTTNDDANMLQAALAGLGLVQLPDLVLQPFLAAGRLVAVLEDWQHRLPGFYLYSPAGGQMAPKVRALYDFLREKRECSVSARN